MMKWGTKIGVDLGTATILIDIQGRGLVLHEPSVVAVHKKTGKVMAVGVEAKDMLGRTPGVIEAIRPLREGVISDFEATEALLKTLLARVSKGWMNKIIKPTVMVCVPSVISPVERRAVEESCHQAGMGKVYLIQEPVAAALGAGLDITQARGNLVVDIGGGTTDVSVISLCEPVVDATIKVAGDVFDESIIRYVRQTHRLLIGEKTAEQVKQKIACVHPDEEERSMEIRGRSLLTGLPDQVVITSEDTRKALEEPMTHILEAVRSVMEQTPPELTADISETGITMTGGGALLRGLDRLIADATGLEVRVADDPITCVVRGTAAALNMLEYFG